MKGSKKEGNKEIMKDGKKRKLEDRGKSSKDEKMCKEGNTEKKKSFFPLICHYYASRYYGRCSMSRNLKMYFNY
jgi:hypothetical protein